MAGDKRAAEYLGKAVSMARIERGLKRTELEERTQLSYAYLSEIEKGRKYPSQAAVAKLAEALDLTPFELLSRAEMLERGVVTLLPVEDADLARMHDLMKKYRDLPMDLADAALVAVAEREKVRRIFTLDRRDFAIYQPAKLGRFAILPR